MRQTGAELRRPVADVAEWQVSIPLAAALDERLDAGSLPRAQDFQVRPVARRREPSILGEDARQLACTRTIGVQSLAEERVLAFRQIQAFAQVAGVDILDERVGVLIGELGEQQDAGRIDAGHHADVGGQNVAENDVVAALVVLDETDFVGHCLRRAEERAGVAIHQSGIAADPPAGGCAVLLGVVEQVEGLAAQDAGVFGSQVCQPGILHAPLRRAAGGRRPGRASACWSCPTYS